MTKMVRDALNPKQRKVFLIRVGVITLLIWAIVSAIAAKKVFDIHKSFGVAFIFWLSPLAGPFAFAEQKLFLQNPALTGVVVVICLGCMAFSLGRRHKSTMGALIFLAVSFWVYIGFAITYLGV